jgi:hypothetical protein
MIISETCWSLRVWVWCVKLNDVGLGLRDGVFGLLSQLLLRRCVVPRKEKLIC